MPNARTREIETGTNAMKISHLNLTTIVITEQKIRLCEIKVEKCDQHLTNTHTQTATLNHWSGQIFPARHPKIELEVKTLRKKYITINNAR